MQWCVGANLTHPTNYELRAEGRRQGCRLVVLDNQVFELELHVAAAVPFVNAGLEHDRAGGVRGELPGLLGHIPADGLDLRIALNHAHLEVVLELADETRLAHDPDMAGQQEWAGIAYAVRLELLDLGDHGYGQHAEGHLGVDDQHLLEMLGRYGGPAALLEPLGEGRKMALGQLQPRRRGVPAETDQALGAIADRLVKVEAGHRPRRALGKLVAEGHDHGWPLVIIDQPAGDDADHAGVPALAAQDDRPPFFQTSLGLDHLLRLLDDLALDLLAAAIDEIEFLGDCPG